MCPSRCKAKQICLPMTRGFLNSGEGTANSQEIRWRRRQFHHLLLLNPPCRITHSHLFRLLWLSRRRRTIFANAAINDTRPALAIGVGAIIVGVGVSGALAGSEEGRCGALGDVLLWVVADGTGAGVVACMAVME